MSRYFLSMSYRKRKQPAAPGPIGHSTGFPRHREFRSWVALVASGSLLLACLLVFRRTNISQDDRDPSVDKPQDSQVSSEFAADDVGLSGSETIPILSTHTEDLLDDPKRDGWQSEVVSQRASRQLKKLGELLADGDIHDRRLAFIAADDFRCGPLIPKQLITVYQDGAIHVQRGMNGVPTTTSSRQGFAGPSGLAQALRQLLAPVQPDWKVRAEFKLFRIESSADVLTTRQYVALTGQGRQSPWELHATWIIRWRKPEANPSLVDSEPRMASIAVEDFEQARRTDGGGFLFSDCTASVLGGNASYRDQFLHGFNYWLERSQDSRFNYLLGNPGIALGDVNGDGLDDVYVCQEAGLPNRLFVQRSDGTAEDVSQQAGVDWLENSRCALLVDLDNDGDQDLAVAINGGIVAAANDGRGRFAVREVLDSSDDVLSLTAADYDLDGRLDLYAGAYHRGALPDGSPEPAIAAASAGVVYHDANSGGANSLFRNLTTDADHWRFAETTQAIGLDQNNRRFTLAAAWEDFDNDGDQDLYVANDFGRNNLYRNEVDVDGQRRFVDVAASTRTEDSASGMSVTWADYDRDGWTDVYVSNMFSAAGNRIAFQSQFKPEADPEIRARIQRFARGNTLLRNNQAAVFSDVSEETGVTMGRWAWSSNFVDLNNDGWDDLLVANGYITTDDTGDL